MHEMVGMMTGVADILKFMMAGNAYFTLVSPTGQRKTFRVYLAKKDKTKYPNSRRVALLTGPNNEADYTGLGFINNGKFNAWNGLSEHAGVKTFAGLWNRLNSNQNPLTTVQFWHEGRCGRCGKKLTVPESIASGIGPVCEGIGAGF
jgi:hypothetical protein